jgi:hypothetical protein
VNCGFPRCSCPDFEHSPPKDRQRCKHIWAAALMTRLAAELENSLKTEPAPKPKRQKLSESLGQHCQKLHSDNQRAAERLPVAPVIPIRK